MKPLLFECPLFSIYTYGVFVAVAFLVSTSLLSIDAKRRGFDESLVYNLCLILLVSGIVFARLFYVLLNWDYFKVDVLEIFMLQHGGLVWFGGLAGALASGLVFLKRKKIATLEMLDILVPYVALAQAIGRIGCFFNGCCHGRPQTWGIYFPVHNRILFPSQLLDSFTLLLIFVILRLIGGRRRGEILCLYLILAAVQRFSLEFIRGDPRPFYGALSIFQWISIGMFACGVAFYLILTWKKRSA